MFNGYDGIYCIYVCIMYLIMIKKICVFCDFVKYVLFILQGEIMDLQREGIFILLCYYIFILKFIIINNVKVRKC